MPPSSSTPVAAAADVLAAASRRPTLSLSWSLPLFTVLLLLAAAAVAFSVSAARGETALFDRAETDLRIDAARLARHAASRLDGRLQELQADMEHDARDARLAEAMIVAADGRIALARPAREPGTAVAQAVAGWDAAAFARALAGSPQVDRDDRRLTLAVLQPIPGPGTAAQGVVYMRHDLGSERQRMHARVLQMRWIDVAIALVLAGLMGALLRRWVALPLQDLQTAARDLAAGRHTRELPERGPAEVASVARSFNAMVRALDQARMELVTSEERLATVIHSTGDAMMALDRQLRVTLLNPVAQALCGWSEDDARGRPVAEVFNIENARTGQPAEFPIERVVQEGIVIGLANHTQLVARDGRRTHIADSAAPIRDKDGRLGGAIVVFRDVTEQYRLQEALARSEWHYRTLADSGNGMIWTIDEHGRRAWGNRNWLRFCGSSEESIERDWPSLLHPDDRARHFAAWRRALAEHTPVQLLVRYRRHDGVYRWIMHDGAPRFDIDGRFIGYIGHGLDVTELREAQARLQEQLEELQRWHAVMLDRESRVSELKAEVNALSAALGRPARYASAEGDAPPGLEART